MHRTWDDGRRHSPSGRVTHRRTSAVGTAEIRNPDVGPPAARSASVVAGSALGRLIERIEAAAVLGEAAGEGRHHLRQLPFQPPDPLPQLGDLGRLREAIRGWIGVSGGIAHPRPSGNGG